MVDGADLVKSTPIFLCESFKCFACMLDIENAGINLMMKK